MGREERERLWQAYQDSMENPVEAEFGTGVHPDQFESYPLSRTSTGSYAAAVEALDIDERDEDILYIDPSTMSAFATRDDPRPDDFKDIPIQYSISISRDVDGEPRGIELSREGRMVFEPIDPVEANGVEQEVASMLVTSEPLDYSAEDLYFTFKNRPLHVQTTAQGETKANTVTDVDPEWKNKGIDPNELLEEKRS